MSVTPFRMKPVFGTVLVAALLVTLPAYAGSEKVRITAKTDIKPLVTLSARESQAMSLAAGRILLHTDRARMAIVGKDKKTALKEIDQGLTLDKILKKALPKYKVVTTITAGDDSYSAEDEVGRYFVPVFNEQYIEDVIAPIVQAKTERAKGHGEKSGKLPAVVDYSIWRKSAMKLNIVTAAEAMAMAKRELEKGHFDNADLALALLQTESVVFEFDEVELPLTEAADDLKLAELEVSEGKINQSQATLKRASDNLKIYEGIVGKSRAKDVRKLHKEIDELASSLTKGNPSESALDKAGKKIASYWDRAVKWFK